MSSMFDKEDQARAYQKLISAVIGLAIKDAQIKPVRYYGDTHRTPLPEALSAMQFLFTGDSDGYLTLLEINPEQFRKRLVDQMFDSSFEIKGIKGNPYLSRKNFKFNYIWFYKNRERAKEILVKKVYEAAEDVGGGYYLDGQDN